MMHAWDRLTAQLRTGSINRRQFLAAAGALGVSASAMGRALAQTPKRGGHLVLGISEGGSSDSFDPAMWNATFLYNMGAQVYDTLAVANHQMELVPSLAESWEAKPGGKEWVFKLRRGVTFHNGKTMTAADVIYSLNHHRGKDSKSMARSLVADIENIAASGPDEITITLANGNADLPYLLTDWRMAIGPEGMKFEGIGTGAFAIESFEPGVRLRVKRNAKDWRQDRGYVDSVETIVINDPAARLNALLSGAVHLICKVPSASVELLERNPNTQIFNVAGSSHPTLAMLTDATPFNNPDLRLAMKYAVDREAILKTVYRGHGILGNDQPIPPSFPFYSKDIPQRQFDPDKAKFHLKKSGYTGPLVFTVADASFSGAMSAAQVFQAGAAKAGITIQIDRVPNDGYFAKYWSKVPFFGSTWGGKASSDLLLATEFSGVSPINETHWKNEKFDQLLTASRIELDKSKRARMYHDMQMLIHEDGGTIIPVFQSTLDGASKKVRGFKPSPVQQLSGYRAAEAIWLEA